MAFTLTNICTLPNEHWEKMEVEIIDDSINISCDLGRVQMSHEDFDRLCLKVEEYRQGCAALEIKFK